MTHEIQALLALAQDANTPDGVRVIARILREHLEKTSEVEAESTGDDRSGMRSHHDPSSRAEAPKSPAHSSEQKGVEPFAVLDDGVSGFEGTFYATVGGVRVDTCWIDCDRHYAMEEIVEINTAVDTRVKEAVEKVAAEVDLNWIDLEKKLRNDLVAERAEVSRLKALVSGQFGPRNVDEIRTYIEQGDRVDRIYNAQKIAALEKERDAFRAEATSAWKELDVEYSKARSRKALLDERDVFRADRDHLAGEIDRLANYILEEIPGEPSQNQGAVDTAIRYMRTLRSELDRLRIETASLQEQVRLTDELESTEPKSTTSGEAFAQISAVTDRSGWWAFTIAGIPLSTGCLDRQEADARIACINAAHEAAVARAIDTSRSESPAILEASIRHKTIEECAKTVEHLEFPILDSYSNRTPFARGWKFAEAVRALSSTPVIDRTCEFCGCNTNAKQRRCCETGERADKERTSREPLTPRRNGSGPLLAEEKPKAREVLVTGRATTDAPTTSGEAFAILARETGDTCVRIQGVATTFGPYNAQGARTVRNAINVAHETAVERAREDAIERAVRATVSGEAWQEHQRVVDQLAAVSKERDEARKIADAENSRANELTDRLYAVTKERDAWRSNIETLQARIVTLTQERDAAENIASEQRDRAKRAELALEETSKLEREFSENLSIELEREEEESIICAAERVMEELREAKKRAKEAESRLGKLQRWTDVTRLREARQAAIEECKHIVVQFFDPEDPDGHLLLKRMHAIASMSLEKPESNSTTLDHHMIEEAQRIAKECIKPTVSKVPEVTVVRTKGQDYELYVAGHYIGARAHSHEAEDMAIELRCALALILKES